MESSFQLSIGWSIGMLEKGSQLNELPFAPSAITPKNPQFIPRDRKNSVLGGKRANPSNPAAPAGQLIPLRGDY